MADIILIQKPGKPPHDVTSYRPISLLPILGKLLEKLILRRLTTVIEENNLIPDHQFGFKKGHSPIEQVHRVVELINHTFEKKGYCTAAFLDVSQAFDRVWHVGLLYKLKKVLPHTLYLILKSYLHERYFRVKYGLEVTQLYPVGAGVPQGSVLGPTLYLLFTSDLPTCPYTRTATFADDKAILASHADPGIAARMLQQHLYQIQRWTKSWRILINETKSVHVTFTKCRGASPQVSFNGHYLPQADNVKYLGIHLDKGLTWKTHIFNKRKQLGHKLSKYYWLIGRKSILSLSNKLLLYKVAFKPIWTYGIQLGGSASTSNIEILERFQTKVLRIITNAPW